MSSMIYGASKALFVMLPIAGNWEIKYRLSRKCGKFPAFHVTHFCTSVVNDPSWHLKLELFNLILFDLYSSRLIFLPGTIREYCREYEQRIWDSLTHMCQNGGLELFQFCIGFVHQDTWNFFLHDKFSQWKQ